MLLLAIQYHKILEDRATFMFFARDIRPKGQFEQEKRNCAQEGKNSDR